MSLNLHRREMQTYLHQNVEIKLTGRTARKQKKTRRSVIEGTGSVEVELHEVTPLDIEDGSWKAWVNLDDLYKIEAE